MQTAKSQSDQTAQGFKLLCAIAEQEVIRALEALVESETKGDK